MSRESTPYVVGDFWLDKRRDGKSPDIWQIATYDGQRRQVVYRSTHCRSLDDAKGVIRAHEEAGRSKRPQTLDNARVIPNLMVYWNEHGRHTEQPATIASSMRAFMGFLMQDEATVGATVADLNKALFKRFVKWRMNPHAFEIAWGGKTMKLDSKGVVGESVQRNLDDIRAALNHQADNNRIPFAPKVPSVESRYRSPPRDRVLTVAELGRIVGIAAYSPAMARRVCLVLSTMVRPEASLAMDPAKQWKPDLGLIDLHPVGAPRTKKHNPIVPVIAEMRPILDAWAREGATPIRESKTAWRTLRKLAGLGQDVHLKTIRHTVATMMLGMGAPPHEISAMLGHVVMKGSSAVYAKYQPTYLVESKAVLSTIFRMVMTEAYAWSAVHILSKKGNGPIEVRPRDCQNSKQYKA